MQLSLASSHERSPRLPARRDMLQVFGIVLFAVFGWAIRGFFYKIPAFALYFGITTDLAILCYMFAFALFESLIVTGLLIALAVVLPPHLFAEGFGYKGFIVVLVATVAMIVFESWYKVEYFKDIMAGDHSSIPPFVVGLVLACAALAGLLWLFHWKPGLRRYVLNVAERFTLFTYIYVPLGLLGLIVVIVRNLL